MENFQIVVYARIRPFLKNEDCSSINLTTSLDKTSIVYKDFLRSFEQKLDQAFDQNTNQKEIFDKLSKQITSAINIHNLTIFTYGQSGSGKTFTIFGREQQNENCLQQTQQITTSYEIENDFNDAGIIPRYNLQKKISSRTIFHIFKQKLDIQISCSFLQIYNEKIIDLFAPLSETDDLQIRENKENGIYISGLKEFSVSTYQDCIALIKQGETNRMVRQTITNAKSSRSHSIYTLTIGTKIQKNGIFQKTKINLCDLAGSEKLHNPYILQSKQFVELKNINQSITTLGRIIRCLSENQKFIPFRESKLTRILQESFCSNTQIMIIGTLSPKTENIEDTFNTLKFLESAKKVKKEVKEISVDSEKMIENLQKEVKYLKSILYIRKQGFSQVDVEMNLIRLQEENQRLREVNGVNIDQANEYQYRSEQKANQHLKESKDSSSKQINVNDNIYNPTELMKKLVQNEKKNFFIDAGKLVLNNESSQIKQLTSFKSQSTEREKTIQRLEDLKFSQQKTIKLQDNSYRKPTILSELKNIEEPKILNRISRTRIMSEHLKQERRLQDYEEIMKEIESSYNK